METGKIMATTRKTNQVNEDVLGDEPIVEEKKREEMLTEVLPESNEEPLNG